MQKEINIDVLANIGITLLIVAILALLVLKLNHYIFTIRKQKWLEHHSALGFPPLSIEEQIKSIQTKNFTAIKKISPKYWTDPMDLDLFSKYITLDLGMIKSRIVTNRFLKENHKDTPEQIYFKNTYWVDDQIFIKKTKKKIENISFNGVEELRDYYAQRILDQFQFQKSKDFA